MTDTELQEVVAAVIEALKTNGKTIDQLTAVTALANSDNLEVSGGKKISFGKLKEIVATDVTVSAEEIKGYVVIDSTSELPEEPTPEQQQKAYLLDTTLYVYVGTGGDTLDGKYQSAQLKGEDGNPGNDGVGFEDVSAPSTADGTWVLTLDNGDNITMDLNHVHPQYQDKVVTASTIPAGGALPNVCYNLGTTDSVTITLASGESGIANVWMFTFTAQSSACSVTLPSVVKLANSYAWDMVAGRRYEVTIMENVATVIYSD